MAFNLKKVLKALLFSTNQPLSIKDVQAAITRFHEQATLPTEVEAEVPEAPVAAASPVPGEPPLAVVHGEAISALSTPPVAAEEPAEIALEPMPAEADLYQEVPSLITATQVREAMDQISEELKVADEGLLLVESSGGYRLVTHPRFARWVRILRAEPPPVKLTQSAIETLAIVAYRQPVTRGEIETIRGVSAEAGINKLLERELVYVVGRADLPGRPIQYGTTDAFLEFVGVRALDELPASDVLSNRQIDDWLKQATNPATPGDTDMGLADEQQLPLEGTADTAESVTAAASVAAVDPAVVEAEVAAPAEARAPTALAEPAEESPAAPTTDKQPDA